MLFDFLLPASSDQDAVSVEADRLKMKQVEQPASIKGTE